MHRYNPQLLWQTKRYSSLAKVRELSSKTSFFFFYFRKHNMKTFTVSFQYKHNNSPLDS